MSADDDDARHIEGPTLEEIDQRIELDERDRDMIGWLIVHELSDGDPNPEEQIGAAYREAAYNLADGLVSSGMSAWRYRETGGIVTSDIGETVNVRELLTADACDAIARWRRHEAFRAGLHTELETETPNCGAEKNISKPREK